MDLARTGILLVVGSLVIFFLFQIGIVLWQRMNNSTKLREHLSGATYVDDLRMTQHVSPAQRVEEPAQIAEHQGGNPLPDIPGQTPEQVRTPEPTQRQVNRSQAAEPEPSESSAPQQEEAGFTERLRHPEASFQRHPGDQGSTAPEVQAGRASQISSPGAANQQPFASELAQNGGELMNGLFAFDSQEPQGFSSLF